MKKQIQSNLLGRTVIVSAGMTEAEAIEHARKVEAGQLPKGGGIYEHLAEYGEVVAVFLWDDEPAASVQLFETGQMINVGLKNLTAVKSDAVLLELEALADWVEEFALPAMGDDTEGGNAMISSARALIENNRLGHPDQDPLPKDVR